MYLVCASEISWVELACSDQSGEAPVLSFLSFPGFVLIAFNSVSRGFFLPAQLPLACFKPKGKVDSEELNSEVVCPALLT